MSAVLRDSVGFRSLSSEGLISPSFPGTFAPSAFHRHIAACLIDPSPADGSEWRGEDWVFREVDLDNIGHSDWHLSSFRMAVWLARAPHSEARTAFAHYGELAVRLLAKRPRNDGREIIVAVPTPLGRTYGTIDRALPAEALASLPDPEIVYVGGDVLITNVRRDGEPMGPRAELFYCASSSAPAVEFATVVCEQGTFDKRRSRVNMAPVSICGVAIGIERLATLTRGEANIYRHEPIAAALVELERSCGPRNCRVYSVEVRQAVDACRSLIALRHLTGLAEQTGNRKSILKRLGARVIRWGALSSLAPCEVMMAVSRHVAGEIAPGRDPLQLAAAACELGMIP